MWHFQERTGGQILTGVQALCPDCHHAKHLFPVRSKRQWKVSFSQYTLLVPSLRDKEQRRRFARKTLVPYTPSFR